ncbi:hypothetical protein CR513_19163, partial [Mucuna pruriens]
MKLFSTPQDTKTYLEAQEQRRSRTRDNAQAALATCGGHKGGRGTRGGASPIVGNNESHNGETGRSDSTTSRRWSEEIDETHIPPKFREPIIKLFDEIRDPHTHLQAFQTHMYISGGNDALNCNYPPSPRSIRSFKDLATFFASQFVANKKKRLEVAGLFDVRQAKGETLKSYLAQFNNVTVRVNDPDQKFFVKAFQKGLRVGQFSDSLALRRPLSMEEIRARTEKHIEVKEDQAGRLEAERQSGTCETRLAQPTGQKGEHEYPSKLKENPPTFTPLCEKRCKYYTTFTIPAC